MCDGRICGGTFVSSRETLKGLYAGGGIGVAMAGRGDLNVTARRRRGRDGIRMMVPRACTVLRM